MGDLDPRIIRLLGDLEGVGHSVVAVRLQQHALQGTRRFLLPSGSIVSAWYLESNRLAWLPRGVAKEICSIDMGVRLLAILTLQEARLIKCPYSMGGNTSTEIFLSQALVLQRDFPFVVNKRFCKSSATTTKLTNNFWSKASDTDGYAVKDAFSGKVIFRVQDSVPGVELDEKTQWLTDAFKIPVTHLKKVRTSTTAYNVYIGKENGNLVTQLEVQYIPFQRDALRAESLDPTAGATNLIRVHGNWRQRTVFITLDRDTGKAHQPIAKVFRADGKSVRFGNADYNVLVAPGVDVAFVVLVCAAMDDALQQSMVSTKK